MISIKSICPFCEQGARRFYKCSDNKTLVLLCDECDSIWLDPTKTDEQEAIFASAPDYKIPGLQCALFGEAADWATESEIHAYGWGGFEFD